MKIKDLDEQIQNYKNSFTEISRKRDLWNNETKTLIKDTLSNITKAYKIDWRVYELNGTKNSEGVNITFGSSASGIYKQDDNGMKSYAKQGGTLTFSQAYNGDIFIIILYPNVEKFVTSTISQKLVEKIDPSKIDEGFIIKKVSGFLIEMTDWENSKSSNSLGFKQNN